jgi:glyoxylase-like metal-dependent hydrolase (beta-lactamase superfamily II)
MSFLRDGAWKKLAIADHLGFDDGDVLDVPGKPRVIHMPGHTQGSSSLYLEGLGVLFTGDALVTLDPLTGHRGPRLLPRAFNRDTAQALQSLKQIEDVEASIVLPGHGEPWTEPVLEAIAHARRQGLS